MRLGPEGQQRWPEAEPRQHPVQLQLEPLRMVSIALKCASLISLKVGSYNPRFYNLKLAESVPKSLLKLAHYFSGTPHSCLRPLTNRKALATLVLPTNTCLLGRKNRRFLRVSPRLLSNCERGVLQKNNLSFGNTIWQDDVQKMLSMGSCDMIGINAF